MINIKQDKQHQNIPVITPLGLAGGCQLRSTARAGDAGGGAGDGRSSRGGDAGGASSVVLDTSMDQDDSRPPREDDSALLPDEG